MTIPITADHLRQAALRSIKSPPNPQSGKREGDPLPILVNANNAPSLYGMVESITGELPPDAPSYQPEPLAAYLRSMLRRWAMKHEQENP
ncbi:hypothetical protein [Leifsonia aquatica]|uniref:hypothetical protein n=1 Tax=Leifsonia aquatica TaxID=144185 RepID=UPI00046AC72B|nr:hypothetical protein [Leifsonia aquatica]